MISHKNIMRLFHFKYTDGSRKRRLRLKIAEMANTKYTIKESKELSFISTSNNTICERSEHNKQDITLQDKLTATKRIIR